MLQHFSRNFFRLVHEISAVLGSPPVRSERLASDLFQTAFAAGGTFEWDPGVRLVGSSPEGLPGEFEGVGAIPLAPVVGGEGGHGQGMAAASGSALRMTLGRMLPG